MLGNRILSVFIGILCLGAPALRAQSVRETTRSELPAFSRIELGGEFQAEIRYGKQYQAHLGVETLLADYVRFEVADSTLSVVLDERRVPVEVKRLFRGQDAGSPSFRLVVTMPETLRSLRLTGRAALLAADDLVVDPSGIGIAVTDNARIAAFALRAERVDINLDKRAEASLQAVCDSLQVRLSGSASLQLEQHARTADIGVAGSSALVVSGEVQRLALQARGASKSILNGTAPMARYQLSGTSNVNAVNLESGVARAELSGLCTLLEAASDDLFADLSSGSTLVFLNDPAIHVLGVKNATLIPYDRR